ncbi:MAG: hypothetical protein MJ116_07170, partial [Lachnospiraceae bacterium]|nr:hypothetical protein [Lachnospiraceae bacterium]
LRPPGPKPGALAKLSYTPMNCFNCLYISDARHTLSQGYGSVNTYFKNILKIYSDSLFQVELTLRKGLL